MRAVAALQPRAVSVSHLHVSTLKPFLDPDVLDAVAQERYRAITMENHTVVGGLGTAQAETTAEASLPPQKRWVRIGLPDCRAIAEGTAVPMAHVKPIFPAPGGGMHLRFLPELLELYGRDVVFLVGGDLHKHGLDLAKASARFGRLAESL